MDIKVQWRKMVLTVRWVCCGIIHEGVRRFLEMEVVLAWWMVLVNIDHAYESKCESRCLFSCRHFDNISDFLFTRQSVLWWVSGNCEFLMETKKEFFWCLAAIIITMSHHQHGYPWASLATNPYRPSLLAGPQGCILYLHRPDVCMFELVTLPLLGHGKGST